MMSHLKITVIYGLLFICAVSDGHASGQQTETTQRMQQSLEAKFKTTVSSYYLAIVLVRDGQAQQAQKLIAKKKNFDEEMAYQIIEDYLQNEITEKTLQSLFKGEHLLFKEKKYTEAIAQYQKAIKSDKEYTPSYILLATRLFNQGKKTSEAIKIMNQVIALDPDNHLAHEKIATYYFAEGDEDQAYKHLVKSKKLLETLSNHSQ
ncbi:MAG: tetratricopeptide repeat protein [Candidatus Omnitrophica bacterium]|nr:tetratricopeptide repeat protein [Candidatus Omnitrophota bacterium]